MKRKGFTLIELLAVIVILAVIAMIATPMIMNVIEKVRKSAFESSIKGAFDGIDYYLLENEMINIPEEGIFIEELSLKNNHFESGMFVKNEEGKIEAVNISNGVYCGYGEQDSLVITKGKCDEKKPEVPIWKEKSVTEDKVILNYESEDKIICYYGTNENEINQKGINKDQHCEYPIEAIYAKVCAVSSSGTKSCSDPKKLGEYLIQNGKLLVEFEPYNTVLTQFDNHFNVFFVSGGNRKGMYTKEPIDFQKYSYLYADLDVELYIPQDYEGGTSNPDFNIAIPKNVEDYLTVGKNILPYASKLIIRGQNVSGGWKEKIKRNTYSLNVTNVNESASFGIRRNQTIAEGSANIYNVWLQYTD